MVSWTKLMLLLSLTCVITESTWHVYVIWFSLFSPELFPILQHQRRFLERRHLSVDRYQKPRQYRTRYANHSRVSASSSSVSVRAQVASDSRVSASSSATAVSDRTQHASDSRVSASFVSDRTWFAGDSRCFASPSASAVSNCTWFAGDSRVSASSVSDRTHFASDSQVSASSVSDRTRCASDSRVSTSSVSDRTRFASDSWVSASSVSNRAQFANDSWVSALPSATGLSAHSFPVTPESVHHEQWQQQYLLIDDTAMTPKFQHHHQCECLKVLRCQWAPSVCIISSSNCSVWSYMICQWLITRFSHFYHHQCVSYILWLSLPYFHTVINKSCSGRQTGWLSRRRILLVSLHLNCHCCLTFHVQGDRKQIRFFLLHVTSSVVQTLFTISCL